MNIRGHIFLKLFNRFTFLYILHFTVQNNEIPEKSYQTDKKSELPAARNPVTCEKIPNTIDPKENAGLNVNKTQIQQFYSGQTIFITGVVSLNLIS